MSNIYYHPENHGLEVVGEIEMSEPDYSFDMLVVWKKKRGEYYWATDSGCSCPSPFEDYNSLSDLNGPYTKQSLKSSLEIYKKSGEGYHDISEGEFRSALRDILDRLK